MTQFPSVTLLYTANLGGDLALLPRLFTLIQQARQAASGPVFLLDLGDTCALDSWTCRVTQGRAPLIVLDGMGYDAVLIGGPERVPIPVESLERLQGTLGMCVAIWGRAVSLSRHEITLSLASGQATPPPEHPVVRVDRSTAVLPRPGTSPPVLGDVQRGSLARVDVSWPHWAVESAQIIASTPHTPAHPTIGAIVDLVENEARAYAQQQGEI